MIKTPVVLLIFKRPDTTAQIFDAVRQAQPSKLFVIADGPRPDRPEEAEKCVATRAIIDRVDWDCEVFTNYSDTNLGCRVRISSGLDWVFSQVDDAIILEDDCLPHSTFFQFCEELLSTYRDDERVMMVTGFNMLEAWKSELQSYHFSYFRSVWGWATWKRAWQHYDVNIKIWSDPEVKNRVRDVLADDLSYHYRAQAFDDLAAGKVDSWAYQWDLTLLAQSGLCIVPSTNLISNIGFTEEATHSKVFRSGITDLPLLPMAFPLRRPVGVAVDREYDSRRVRKRYGRPRRKFLLKLIIDQTRKMLRTNFA